MLFSKKAKLLYLFVCISSLTPACSEDSDDTPINKDILIGGIAPLSGDAALYGRMDKLVTDLIFDEINANGGINGRQVDVIWHDTKCDPALAKTKAQELIDNGVRIIFGDSCSGSTLAAAGPAEENEVILFTSSSSNTQIKNSGDFVFRVFPSDETSGTVLSHYANANFSNIGILTEQTEYAQGITAGFLKTYSGSAENKSLNASQTGFDIYCDKARYSFLAAINGPIEIKNKDLKIVFFNKKGQKTSNKIHFKSIKPFEVMIVNLDNFKNLRKFFNGEKGFCKVEVPTKNVFNRILAGTFSRDKKKITTTDSYYDCSPIKDFISLKTSDEHSCFIPFNIINDIYLDVVIYPIFSRCDIIFDLESIDKNGQKMSKRLGNAVDPFKTISKFGPDATRWYMISNANPWDNLKFDLDGIEESKRKFFGTLYNVYSFFALYANIDNFKYSESEINISDRPELDKWILSELNSLIAEVDDHYDNYEPTKAARAISNFVQLYLSNWYVRLSRRRFWKGSYSHDKISAYQTLYKCLTVVSKLSSPIAPFFMDRLYKDLVNNTSENPLDSVHHDEFPVSKSEEIYPDLQKKIRNAQTICSLVLSLRKKEKIKVRQPLSKIMIPFSSENEKKEILEISELIKSEVNVKEVELISNSSGILIKKVKPNFKSLGPKLGKKLSAVMAKIKTLSDSEIQKIEANKPVSITIDSEDIILEPSDLEIISEDIEGWLVASENGVTVALDIQLNDTLINEGICRELVNRIQTLRKESGLLVTDKINLKIKKDIILEKAIFENQNYILTETLAENLIVLDNFDDGVELKFDNIDSKLYLTKID